jgi:hypothetical protein
MRGADLRSAEACDARWAGIAPPLVYNGRVTWRDPILAVILLAIAPCWAQPSASVSGTIEDQTAAVIANAKVTLRGRNLEMQTTSSATGAFALSSLPAGEYVLTVESSGFYPSPIRVRLSDGQPLSLGGVTLYVPALGLSGPAITFVLLPNLETGNLYVRVLTEEGTPLADADVVLTCSKPGCGKMKTSSSGEVRFQGLESGMFLLEVSGKGFSKQTFNVRIVNGVEVQYPSISLYRCRDAACTPPPRPEGILLE